MCMHTGENMVSQPNPILTNAIHPTVITSIQCAFNHPNICANASPCAFTIFSSA